MFTIHFCLMWMTNDVDPDVMLEITQEYLKINTIYKLKQKTVKITTKFNKSYYDFKIF
jgi:hypothetical protein